MTDVIARTISALSVCFSVLTYYRASEFVQNALLRKEKMRMVAARTILVWDQMQTIITAKVKGFAVDPYLFPSKNETSIDSKNLLTKRLQWVF